MTVASPAAMPQRGLPPRHLALALGIAAVWGTNFVVIKIGLDVFPPFLFAFLRFCLVFFPAALFLARPLVAWSRLAAYGILIGGGQFGLLYLAIRGHITPGLASLILQSQVFFTIALAVWRAGERILPLQWLAIGGAGVGLALIAWFGGGDATPFGLILVLLAGGAWACANMVIRADPTADMLAYIVWASLAALPPLLVLSLLVEGPEAAIHAVRSAPASAWAALLWQSFGNTLFGFTAWGWLLGRHPAAAVTPTALLVPVFGMAASSLLLGEMLQSWKLLGSVAIVGARFLNILAPRWADLPLTSPKAGNGR